MNNAWAQIIIKLLDVGIAAAMTQTPEARASYQASLRRVQEMAATGQEPTAEDYARVGAELDGLLDRLAAAEAAAAARG